MTPPPVLRLVPGLGLDAAAWRPTVRSLPAGWRRDLDVALLPGYGERAPRRADLRPAALAELLLDRWCPPDTAVVLAGHSASCQVVAEAARRRPDRVAGLVLVGPTTDPRAPSWSSLARRWLATARHERVGQVPTLLRQYSRTGLWTMARAMDAARHHDVRESVHGSGCPILVLRGHHDRICPEDWAAELAELAGAAPRPADHRLPLPVTVPGAHMVPLTHGPLVARELERFGALVSR
jgi:pimeloyl-ACP methyl ester carboxylesterase